MLVTLQHFWPHKTNRKLTLVNTCESSCPPSWRRWRPASSRSSRSSSCASAFPLHPAGCASATTMIWRSRPRRSSTGTVGAGDGWGRPNKMGDALGGWGEVEADDAAITKAVENRIRCHRRPSLLPLLVFLLLLLRILPPVEDDWHRRYHGPLPGHVDAVPVILPSRMMIDWHEPPPSPPPAGAPP